MREPAPLSRQRFALFDVSAGAIVIFAQAHERLLLKQPVSQRLRGMARSAGRAVAAVDTVTAATALHGPRKLGGRVKGVLGSSERPVKVQDVAHQAQPAKLIRQNTRDANGDRREKEPPRRRLHRQKCNHPCQGSKAGGKILATGIEPATPGLGNRRSIL